jgi:hypothetical protein
MSILLVTQKQATLLFTGLESSITSATASTLWYALVDRNIAPIVDSKMTRLGMGMLDKNFRKWLPIKWDKETEAYKFDGDKHTKIMDTLSLVKETMTFEELCDNVEYQVKDAKKDIADAAKKVEAALSTEQKAENAKNVVSEKAEKYLGKQLKESREGTLEAILATFTLEEITAYVDAKKAKILIAA